MSTEDLLTNEKSHKTERFTFSLVTGVATGIFLKDRSLPPIVEFTFEDGVCSNVDYPPHEVFDSARSHFKALAAISKKLAELEARYHAKPAAASRKPAN